MISKTESGRVGYQKKYRVAGRVRVPAGHWCWLVFVGAGLIWDNSGWYVVVVGQYNLVLHGIKKTWVSKRLLCLYILKKSGELVGCHHSGTDGRTNAQTRKDRATQPMDHGRLR